MVFINNYDVGILIRIKIVGKFAIKNFLKLHLHMKF